MHCSFFADRKPSAVPIALALVLFIGGIGAGSADAQQAKAPAKSKKAASATAAETLKDMPQVTQISEAEFSALLKKSADAGRPVLVNFWATWCDPCREEFPDLIKIGEDFGARGLDLVAVSLDDATELKTTVPKFLSTVKMKLPSYLMVVSDEAAFLEMVTAGGNKAEAVVGLPVTVLFDASGKVIYKKSGKFKTDILRAEIEKIITK